jgi:hypothetical protein
MPGQGNSTLYGSDSPLAGRNAGLVVGEQCTPDRGRTVLHDPLRTPGNMQERAATTNRALSVEDGLGERRHGINGPRGSLRRELPAHWTGPFFTGSDMHDMPYRGEEEKAQSEVPMELWWTSFDLARRRKEFVQEGQKVSNRLKSSGEHDAVFLSLCESLLSYVTPFSQNDIKMLNPFVMAKKKYVDETPHGNDSFFGRVSSAKAARGLGQRYTGNVALGEWSGFKSAMLSNFDGHERSKLMRDLLMGSVPT